MSVKAVQLLVNSILPEDLRSYDEDYSVKSLNKILYNVGIKHPDKFDSILKRISDIGRTATYLQGETITLADLEPVLDRDAIFNAMDAELETVSPDDPNYKQKRAEIIAKYNTVMEKETAKNALARRNSIAMSVLSGARGKMPQLKAMTSTPWTYSDYKGEATDFVSRKSFAEGITPVTFLASTPGARASVISTKSSTAKGGDWAKQMAQAASDMVIRKQDCGSLNGISLKTSDESLRGRVLARDVAGYKAGSFITREVQKDLERKGIDHVVARSPLTCGVHNGLCAKCVGKFYNGGRLPKVGDHIGALASTTASEPVCLVKGTMVRMADGTEKPIETISPGEYVMGSDLFGNCVPVRVVNTFHNGIRPCYRSHFLSVDNEEAILESTKEHKVLGATLPSGIDISSMVDAIVAPVGLLKEDTDRFVATASSYKWDNGVIDMCFKSHCYSKLIKQDYIGEQDTWDLEVDNDTHLFALANGLIVSNTQMALCLNESELVKMADGGVKKIKDIVAGDYVLGADKNGNTFPVKVLNVFDQGLRAVRKFFFDQGGKELSVICTDDHKFLFCDHTVHAIGDLMYSILALKQEGAIITDTPFSPAYSNHYTDTYMSHCYDIEIDHPDHLFVLDSGLITSNSAKHTGGMSSAKRSYSGLEVIQQFTQSPEKFKDRAAVSELDGKVTSIEDAPQGGKFVFVGDEKHYVPTGHAVEVNVGDVVEAGDQLSEGLVDPEDIVRLKGLGAGRLYYNDRLNQILADSGAKTDKRNTEILARAALRHVKITGNESVGNYLPDDVVDYNSLQSTYVMPEDTIISTPDAAIGKHLQQPALHYTIGTRITPSVAKDLKDNSYTSVYAADSKPEFEPEMIRLRTASHSNPDWIASLGTSYLTQQLQNASIRGDDSNYLYNDDYRPRLAFGVGFAKNIEQTGKF